MELSDREESLEPLGYFNKLNYSYTIKGFEDYFNNGSREKSNNNNERIEVKECVPLEKEAYSDKNDELKNKNNVELLVCLSEKSTKSEITKKNTNNCFYKSEKKSLLNIHLEDDYFATKKSNSEDFSEKEIIENVEKLNSDTKDKNKNKLEKNENNQETELSKTDNNNITKPETPCTQNKIKSEKICYKENNELEKLEDKKEQEKFVNTIEKESERNQNNLKNNLDNEKDPERVVGNNKDLDENKKNSVKDQKDGSQKDSDKLVSSKNQKDQGNKSQKDSAKLTGTKNQKDQGNKSQKDSAKLTGTKNQKDQGNKTQKDSNKLASSKNQKDQGNKTQKDSAKLTGTKNQKDQGNKSQKDSAKLTGSNNQKDSEKSINNFEDKNESKSSLSKDQDIKLKIPYRDTECIPNELFNSKYLFFSEHNRLKKYNAYIHETSELFSVDTACEYVHLSKNSNIK
ncbi:hypothetical protein FG386_000463 [Cryptosporidium ryanae]|uniref:uncharacterized protein n=1 Tax=Cryptosporidium ryanae TaxID=515981 RepID=UPI00351AA786|nr:hypothetical protein FG386_000463 [Cryptosporidium ryanae]